MEGLALFGPVAASPTPATCALDMRGTRFTPPFADTSAHGIPRGARSIEFAEAV